MMEELRRKQQELQVCLVNARGQHELMCADLIKEAGEMATILRKHKSYDEFKKVGKNTNTLDTSVSFL